MFWQKDIETMPRAKLDALQLERLKWVVDYADRNVPFYHKKLAEMKVTADKIKSLSDVQYLPVTTKNDLRDTYPYGLFGKPMKNIVRMHASSGTTGKPIVVGYTRQDLENWADQVARICVAVGITEEDIVQISFGYGLFTGALGLHYGLEKIGAAIVPASSGNTQRQLMLMEDFGATALVSTPSYALYMSELVRERGLRDKLRLRTGLFGSEGCSNEMRSVIAENFGLMCTDNYGLTELNGPGVSGECLCHCGLHFAEDHFLPEIVDSETLAPKAPGEDGELLVTTLTKEGFPMIRYRTKDITRLNYEPCACGRTHVRMDKVKGRSDDMMIIKGVNVFPSQIESVLISVPNIGPHYQLVIRRENHLDNLEVVVEVTNGDLLERYKELEQLRETVRFQLKTVLQLDVKVSLAQPKTLERFEGKAKRIVDLRGKI
ncbi:phenylacetate--CoA ligase [Oscillospiraceae bacterium MB08-C2-2]|nr:phenylacetate--CoA ligase [Oscillospiraceae bacterium MB08-C2-2]